VTKIEFVRGVPTKTGFKRFMVWGEHAEKSASVIITAEEAKDGHIGCRQVVVAEWIHPHDCKKLVLGRKIFRRAHPGCVLPLLRHVVRVHLVDRAQQAATGRKLSTIGPRHCRRKPRADLIGVKRGLGQGFAFERGTYSFYHAAMLFLHEVWSQFHSITE
jgi:hypothetical protein